jgi:hypothetical protein
MDSSDHLIASMSDDELALRRLEVASASLDSLPKQ